MKNLKKNTFILLIITLIILFFVLKDDYENILNNLILANKWFILIGIIMVFLYWLFKALCLYLIVREYNKKVKFVTIFKQILLTQFFNGVTPFSTGGQPMQVYMLRKSGLKVAAATNIIVQDFIMYQFALIVIGIFALLANFYWDFFSVSPTLYSLIIIGFLINLAVGLVLLFISFSKKFNDSIGKLIINIASHTRFVKDKDAVVSKWEEKLSEFHSGAKLFKQNKFLFVKCFCCHLIGLIVYYIIPFFIFLSFDINLAISIPAVITSSAFVLIIGNFVPIPGGSGGIEYGFLEFFGSFIPGAILSSGLIVWRFITYYLGIIVGGITLSFYKGEKNV